MGKVISHFHGTPAGNFGRDVGGVVEGLTKAASGMLKDVVDGNLLNNKWIIIGGAVVLIMVLK